MRGGAARAWVMTKPDRTRFFFDQDGYQTATVDKNGNTMRFGYQKVHLNGRDVQVPTELTDPAGRRTLTLDYQPDGKVKSMTDVIGRRLDLSYDDRGLLTGLTDGAGKPEARTFAFSYEELSGAARLARVRDPRGHDTRITYHRGGPHPRVHKLIDRLGKVTTFEYRDPAGACGPNIVSTVTDPRGHKTRTRIDGCGRPYEVTDPHGKVTELAWDGDNNVVRMEEPNGAVSTWRYDQKTGYPTRFGDAEANRRRGPPTRLRYRTRLDGHVAELVGTTSSAGRRWAFGYDARGNLVTVTDPKGTSTKTRGDYTTRYAYDRHGQLTAETDPNRHTTRFGEYGPAGYPASIVDPQGHSTRLGYDSIGNAVSITDARGKTTTRTYDVFGRPGSVKTPKDQDARDYLFTPAPAYDVNDNVVSSTGPNGAVTTADFDAMDQRIKSVMPADRPQDPGRVSTYAYDANGNQVRQTEPGGNLPGGSGGFTTTFRYDAKDQLVASTDAKGQRTTYGFDSVGNMITMTDPVKNRTRDRTDFTSKLRYDHNGLVTEVIDARGHRGRIAYDLDGFAVRHTDKAGNTTLIRRDPRGLEVEEKVPHTRRGGRIVYRTTRYAYDQAGNQTAVITPRGVQTPGDPDDYTERTRYDELNRVQEVIHPYSKKDRNFNQPDVTRYSYDPVGNLASVSAPPSAGQDVRNDTTYTYYDNGWTRSMTDPLDIVTTYDYNQLGQQTANTITSAGGSTQRTMTWDYYPSGNLRAHSDGGNPVGRDAVLVDNSDAHTAATGSWTRIKPTMQYGYNADTSSGEDNGTRFTWRPSVPEPGDYEVFVRYPQVEDATTDARYTIHHADGSSEEQVDQSERAGQWVKLGSYRFAEGRTHTVTLSGDDGGTVSADAVRLVRESKDPDNEVKDFTYTYDANSNLTGATDRTPGARTANYAITYDQVNQITALEETGTGDPGTLRNTTRFGYDANGSLTTRTHDPQARPADRLHTTFAYDSRDQLSRITQGTSPTDPRPNVTTYRRDRRGQVERQTKPNGNAVTVTHTLDRKIKRQVERQRDGTLVSSHDVTYGPNGDPVRDATRLMNADEHTDYLNTTYSFAYDPRDRIAKVTKTGDKPGVETYRHDAAGNVIAQTVRGRQTVREYDRNRLRSNTVDGDTSYYQYDALGRLSTVTGPDQQTVRDRYRYDGFGRMTAHTVGTGPDRRTTTYTYDPFDRTASRTTGTKTTALNYLGLSRDILSEETAGKITKAYQSTPAGRKITQVKNDRTGTEISHYSHNPRGDVEALTTNDGDTRTTYGYTAYGEPDDDQATGPDKPDPQQPNQEALNNYRFNGQERDEDSGQYFMGFRTYDPGVNRFLTRDGYAGALDDLDLTTDPFTGSRYAFAGGNPITNIELDGHIFGISWSDVGHTALDAAGLVPVVGEAADLVNAGWYAAEGDTVIASLSAAGAVPFAGWAATGGKWAKRGYDAYNSVSKARKASRAADSTKAAPAPPPRGLGSPGSKAGPPSRSSEPPSPARPPRAKNSRPRADQGSGPARSAPARSAPAKRGPAKSASDGPGARLGYRPQAGNAPKAPRRSDACPINSFVSGTKVVLADGSSLPIEKIEPGDTVTATDPATGITTARTVTGTITSTGTKNLVRITVDTDGEQGTATGTLVATDNHLFWAPARNQWLTAAQLKPGMWLRTSAGTHIQVTAIKAWTRTRTVHNLAVADARTYYVLAGTAPVLVHNDNTTRRGVHRTNAADWRELRDIWDQDSIYKEILSSENRTRIARSRVPRVDQQWVKFFPGDADKIGQAITMHHIGGWPITVPLPTSRHMDAHMPGGFRYNPGGPGMCG